MLFINYPKVNRVYMQNFSYAESNKIYPTALSFSVTPNAIRPRITPDPIYLDIDTYYNIFTYDSLSYGHKEYNEYTNRLELVESYRTMTLKLMNLIAHGHLIIIYDEVTDKEYPIGTPSLAFIDQCIIEQIYYLLIQKEYKYITDNFLHMYTLDTFGNCQRAVEYFRSGEFHLMGSERYNTINNLIRDTLLEIQQERELMKINAINSKRYIDISVMLNSLRIPEEFLEYIPNQDTTSTISEMLDYRINFVSEQLGSVKEFQYTSISPSQRQTVTSIDKLEQHLVDAYFFSIPEFRQPTEDDLYQEYLALDKEYEDLKSLAKTSPAEARLKAKAFTAKYIRLQELEERFNTVVFGELRHIESLNRKPKANRYDG